MRLSRDMLFMSKTQSTLVNHLRNSERYLFEILPQLIPLIRILLKKLSFLDSWRILSFIDFHHDVNSDGSYNLFPSLVRKSSFYVLPFLFFLFVFCLFVSFLSYSPSLSEAFSELPDL